MQGCDRGGDRVTDGLGAVAGERGTVLDSRRAVAGHLLRAPRLRPAPVLAPAVTPADPLHLGTIDSHAVRSLHRARQAVLHIPAKFGGSRSASPALEPGDRVVGVDAPLAADLQRL